MSQDLKECSRVIDAALDSICTGLLKPIYDDADMDYHASAADLMRRILERLQKTVDQEDQYISEYIATQEEFIRRLKNRFTREKLTEPTKPEPVKPESVKPEPPKPESDNGGWSIVARKRKQAIPQAKPKSRLLGSALGQTPILSLIPDTVHELAPGILIPSKAIRTPEECHANIGMICWEQASRRFWFSLNGYAISFSMGNVWWTPQDLKKPIKTTEFDPEKYCHPADIRNYYFPPEIDYNIPHPTNDQRNFTSIATFCPTSVEADHPSLRISDRSTLKEDIICAKQPDIRYAADYHSHCLGALIAMHLLYKNRE
jgi:hypothetical protein